ncbi:MAG TPA: thiamine pyrophosphate-binding protein [Anaerolineales bacterium]|nr:thiamine pyrophosphate-binding protein [Anaerolineales bacterium]
MATVAEVLARALNRAGIPRLFGLPGGETSQALDAFRREGLPFVLARHEAAAAFMAAATARLTRSVGACLTTLGPGAANAVVGLAHAYLDRSPVILVTGQMADRLRPGHTHQFLDLQALYAPISKASLQLTPANVQQKVAHALVLARQGRPGPVHLQLTNEDAVRPAEPEGPGAGRQTVLAQEAALNAAMEVLGRARRPVLICGLGLEPEGPYREVLSLAEALHSPVITTPKAKGALPAAHPLSAGVIGLTQTDPAYAVLQEADCVLAVGFDPVELVRPWGHPAPLLWIAPWENADPALSAAAEIVGGLAPSLVRLAEARPAAEAGWGEARVARHRADLAREQIPSAPEPGIASHRSRMSPQQVLTALREVLPEETHVSVDVGSHKILACLDWPMSLPNRFLVSNGLSSMGYGLPAAVAAGLAFPGTPALCLTGDAGLAMTLGELGTLAEAGGPVLVVVFKDDALDLIRSHQRRAGLPPFGTEFRGPDFARIAEAHGIEGVRAEDPSAVVKAAERTLQTRAPLLIEAVIDPAGYPTTPVE